MNKIVVRTPNHLGDCLMALPAVKALALNSDQYEISLLMPRWAETILAGIPRTGFLFLESDDLHGYWAIQSQIRLLRQNRYNSGILLTPSFSSALIFFLAGFKKRTGYRSDWRGFLLNDIMDRPASIVHRARLYHKLIEHFAGRELPVESPHINLIPANADKAGKLMQEHGLASSDRFIAVAPQAVAESRRWGADNYASLSRRIIEQREARIVLLGTIAEQAAGEKVKNGQKEIINLCGLTNIGTAAAILRQAALFIGNDSGLAHLAATVQIPIVVLSGADNPAETSPLSDRKIVIIKDRLPCISCVKNICPKRGDDFMRCMREISVEEVFAAAQKILGQV